MQCASLDEETSIQALERTQLPLPLRTGPAAWHTHDYKRHGVVDLNAAPEIATGQVTHRVTETHTAADFLAFMKMVARAYPTQELHVIGTSLSTTRRPTGGPSRAMKGRPASDGKMALKPGSR
jgi:hypothetical protein